jgi:uncharacterized protein YndB with AHSA1/START domain
MPSATKNETLITVEPGKQEIIVSREFEAPVELLFRAFTDPAHVVNWLGPRSLTMKIETWDARPGGSWRYVSTDPEGNAYGFHGVFHDVTPNDRVIQTFEFEGLPEPGHVALETARFEALPGGRSRLVTLSVFQTVEDRDGMAESGMEFGVRDSHSRLDEFLATLV